MQNPGQSYSLLEFNNLIKQALSREFPQEYWVVAEIGDLKVNQSGHCYIDLVEKEGHRILAKSRAAIWASTYYQLAPWFESKTGEPIKAGMKVMASVKINYHELYGLSLTINHLDPSFTMGERARKRQEVIKQLKKEGLFERNKSIHFPLVPMNIAIISSPTAAGYEDFLNEINHNAYGYKFTSTLYSASLQGEGAVESITKALAKADTEIDHDIAVIIRGGGSQLDLDTFDSYELAKAIAELSIPMITGIGHDRDETIADLVSHHKLKTPTATAQFIIGRVETFEQQMMGTFESIKSFARNKISSGRQDLLNKKSLLRLASVKKVENGRSKINGLQQNLAFLAQNRMITASHRIDLLIESVKQHDPELILEKGYSISYINGGPITKAVKPGDTMLTLTKNQSIESTINKSNFRNGK